MSVPSSISSSEPRLPAPHWLAVLVGGATLAMAFIASMELRLAAKGFLATVEDNPELWMQQRKRAADLGTQALLLIGASRMQLDLDLSVLAQKTSLKPVQLAIDGSSFMPVLEGLAKDPQVRGTVLVSYMDHAVTDAEVRDRAAEWQRLYEQTGSGNHPTAVQIEESLTAVVTGRLRSYADGARPVSSLLLRVLPAAPTRQYLQTLPDRSRLADYRLVPMPEFYYDRVQRTLGEPVDASRRTAWEDLDRSLRARIAVLPVADHPRFAAGIDRIARWSSAIEARGGRVLFLRLPSSGLVHAIEQRRYPREFFWEVFRTRLGRPTLHFEDVAELRGFSCPDGSHLDYRDRAAFTAALVQALQPPLPRR